MFREKSVLGFSKTRSGTATIASGLQSTKALVNGVHGTIRKQEICSQRPSTAHEIESAPLTNGHITIEHVLMYSVFAGERSVAWASVVEYDAVAEKAGQCVLIDKSHN